MFDAQDFPNANPDQTIVSASELMAMKIQNAVYGMDVQNILLMMLKH